MHTPSNKNRSKIFAIVLSYLQYIDALDWIVWNSFFFQFDMIWNVSWDFVDQSTIDGVCIFSVFKMERGVLPNWLQSLLFLLTKPMIWCRKHRRWDKRMMMTSVDGWTMPRIPWRPKRAGVIFSFWLIARKLKRRPSREGQRLGERGRTMETLFFPFSTGKHLLYKQWILISSCLHLSTKFSNIQQLKETPTYSHPLDHAFYSPWTL